MDKKNQETQQPIVVKKKNGGHGGHHGGSWKVAYADFMTAMMAFFLVMWLVGLSDEVKQNVAAYFRDPAGFSKAGSSGVLKGSESLLDNKESGDSIKKDLSRREKEAEVWESLKTMGKNIGRALERMDSFARFKDQIEIELVPDGLRIQLIEAGENRSFFARGSAEMSKEGEEILSAISTEIAELPHLVVIEGHTDSKKYAEGANYTNWELSADRANTARRVMLSAGISPESIKEIRGFASNQPRIEHDPGDPANRRIAIIVLNEYAGGNYSEVMVSSENEVDVP